MNQGHAHQLMQQKEVSGYKRYHQYYSVANELMMASGAGMAQRQNIL